MQTPHVGAETVIIEGMTRTRLIKAYFMETLDTGIFHYGVFAVFPHYGTTSQRVREFLEESAVAAVNHVIVLVNGQLLLAKLLVVCLNDIVARQTTLIVVLPV
jgi:hypothetical protein